MRFLVLVWQPRWRVEGFVLPEPVDRENERWFCWIVSSLQALLCEKYWPLLHARCDHDECPEGCPVYQLSHLVVGVRAQERDLGEWANVEGRSRRSRSWFYLIWDFAKGFRHDVDFGLCQLGRHAEATTFLTSLLKLIHKVAPSHPLVHAQRFEVIEHWEPECSKDHGRQIGGNDNQPFYCLDVALCEAKVADLTDEVEEEASAGRGDKKKAEEPTKKGQRTRSRKQEAKAKPTPKPPPPVKPTRPPVNLQFLIDEHLSDQRRGLEVMCHDCGANRWGTVHWRFVEPPKRLQINIRRTDKFGRYSARKVICPDTIELREVFDAPLTYCIESIIYFMDPGPAAHFVTVVYDGEDKILFNDNRVDPNMDPPESSVAYVAFYGLKDAKVGHIVVNPMRKVHRPC